eukprot:CAMPEP_0202510802 /NCGR_PEP_ID=MMETSP1361-20130828/53482_1 /ASSEMBLY_ACC=CAM_ASM_000849 /TAXON_ID=210615 /ORGANISM="Staurosira complex sp., Strain CCMP2646" /LENGTH=140 /DNA_ID=CAMNT_0049145077 /DNA_START=877 /DNA_END=1298 /DNA_ORIENTATION=-
MKRRLAELSFDGEMLVEMNENQQDSEDEAVRLFHVVVHRFCHAFCQHHNDDDEEFGETKRVEINQIRKEIVMRAVYRAMDKLRRDRIEEVLNPGALHNDENYDEDELDDPAAHFDSQDPCEWPRSESAYGENTWLQPARE